LLLYFFSFFFSAGSADPAAQVFKPKGCENKPRWPNLHPAHGSAGQALAAADPTSRVCRPQACGAANPLALRLQPSAQVCPQRPRLGRPRARCLLARVVARRAWPSPAPWLGNFNAKYRQPELINYN